MTPELTHVLHSFRLAFKANSVVPLIDLAFLKTWVSRHVLQYPALQDLENRLHTVNTDTEVISLLAEWAPGPAPLPALHGLLGAMCHHPNTYMDEFVRSYMAASNASAEISEECPEVFFLQNYPYKRDLQVYYQDLDDAMSVEPGRVGETVERFIYFLSLFDDFHWDNFDTWHPYHAQMQQRMRYLREKGKAVGYYMADPQDLWYLTDDNVYDIKPLELLVFPSAHKEFNPLKPVSSEFFPPQPVIQPVRKTGPFGAFWKWLSGKKA